MKKKSLYLIATITQYIFGQPQQQQIIINPPTPIKAESEYIDALTPEKKQAVVIIEGASGRGTGFIARLKDRLFVFTNQHVIAGNESIEIKMITGEELKYESIFAGEGHDIAIFRLRETRENMPFFEIELQPLANTKIGDSLIIPGNSLGAGTLLQTKGKIVALGPKLIEHNAPTFSGNSGSPLILEGSLKVIGVDTLSKKSEPLDWANKYSRDHIGSQIKSNVRLFGYRIDTINKWQQINLKDFNSQFNEIRELETEAHAVYAAVIGDPWHYQRSDSVSRVIAEYRSRTSNPITSKEDKERAAKESRFALDSHLNVIRDRAKKRKASAYDFFIDDYKRIEELCDGISGDVGNMIWSTYRSDPFSSR
jgi:hypothetical protein